ncbi:MAG: hypothetical protein WC895_01180 [Candidatus Shapirobacteria bacterium]|jgi:large subunit ribosomal protein L1
MSKTSQEKKLKEKKLSETKSASGGELAVEAPIEASEQKAVIETPTEETVEVVDETVHKIRTTKIRSKRYQAAKKKIDVTKYYSLKESINLVKETSLSKFDGKVEAHITILDAGNVGEITFPHFAAASKKVVVLNDTILAEIKEGQINFDALIATPSTMPKLLPFAKTLGPKGLMPNPKNGTLTDKPEESLKKLSVAKTIVKTEKKSPIIHIIIGKVSQPVEELVANLTELIKVIKANKIKKLALCATMGPCVKVKIN